MPFQLLDLTHIDFRWMAAFIGVVLAIFLIIREFWTWYWKLNAIVNRLDKIEEYLFELVKIAKFSLNREQLQELKDETKEIKKNLSNS
jgi:sensor histidine kinase YesM